MYWSADHQTYLPADNAQKTNEKEEDNKKEKDTKNTDKVKTAKKIAKDMEKWAKTLNQKKEATKVNSAVSATTSTEKKASTSSSGIEDIAFTMLNKKEGKKSFGEGLAGLASYGSDSEEESNSAAAKTDEMQFTDFVKLACLLCKRQFPSKEKLLK